jgi:hypothetical protein
VFEIGNSLREARVRRSLDLNQAEFATKIRAKYLRALVDERFEQLPSPTYVKGFLRTYADFLGLDGQLYVDEYNSRFVAGEDSDRVRRSSVRPERRARRLELGIVLVVIVVGVLVALVVAATWSSSGSTPPPTTASTPVEHKPPPARPVPYLQIEAIRGTSYVLVHRDSATGRLLFQGTVDATNPETFNGKRFWVSISSPENLRVLVGGKRVTLRGGKPVVLTVTPSGVRTG